MTIFDVYGTAEANLDRVAGAVGQVLGAQFDARHSSYLGDYYHLARSDADTLTIQPNLNDPDAANEDDRYQEPAFSEVPVLLYVTTSERERAEDYGRRLAGVAGLGLLSREDVPDRPVI